VTGSRDFRPDLEGLDRLLEHRVRLAVAVLLTRYERMSFTRLRDLTGETDGNIGAHLRRMEEAGYLSVEKVFRDRKPLTCYALTGKGRNALRAHVGALESLVRGVDLPPEPGPSERSNQPENDDERT